MQQQTDEWYAARLGKVTASRLADVMAKTKSGPSASRANYLADLVAERLTGKKADGFTNAAIDWGVKTEPLARAAYEAEVGVMVDEVGFIDHPSIAMTGASPDGLISADGMIEIKAPNTATHIATLLDDSAPSKYIPQMQWQMASSGRKWVDFVSYDPRLPPDMQLFIKRVHRDDKLIAEYEAEVVKFLAEVEETVAKLITLRRGN